MAKEFAAAMANELKVTLTQSLKESFAQERSDELAAITNRLDLIQETLDNRQILNDAFGEEPPDGEEVEDEQSANEEDLELAVEN